MYCLSEIILKLRIYWCIHLSLSCPSFNFRCFVCFFGASRDPARNESSSCKRKMELLPAAVKDAVCSLRSPGRLEPKDWIVRRRMWRGTSCRGQSFCRVLIDSQCSPNSVFIDSARQQEVGGGTWLVEALGESLQLLWLGLSWQSCMGALSEALSAGMFTRLPSDGDMSSQYSSGKLGE